MKQIAQKIVKMLWVIKKSAYVIYEWPLSFAMSVAKTFSHSQDEKDIVNGCNHLVNELGNLKEAVGSENLENLELAKAVAKDFAEVTEQSVNRYSSNEIRKTQNEHLIIFVKI